MFSGFAALLRRRETICSKKADSETILAESAPLRAAPRSKRRENDKNGV